MQPHDRDRAISGRLALFQQADIIEQPGPGVVPEADLEWLDLSVSGTAEIEKKDGDSTSSRTIDFTGDAPAGRSGRLYSTVSPPTQSSASGNLLEWPDLSETIVQPAAQLN